MHTRYFAKAALAIVATASLSGCVASALIGSAITNDMVGPPGSGSYTTKANPDSVRGGLESELTKIGTVKSSDPATGEIIGFDAQKHYVYSAKVHANGAGVGSVVDLKVTLIAGALTVGKVKTVDVMNHFVQDLNSTMADAPLVPANRAG